MSFAKNNNKEDFSCAILQFFVDAFGRDYELTVEDVKDDTKWNDLLLEIYQSVS